MSDAAAPAGPATPDDDAGVCLTCGVERALPLPDTCPICADERQYLPPGGQAWSDLTTLAADGHQVLMEEVEPGLLGLRVDPRVGIGQRSLLATTSEGSLLWDPPGFVDDDAAAAVLARGPVLAVAASHPHMSGAQVSWAQRLGGVPVLVCSADAHWVARTGPLIQEWSGTHEIARGLTLHQIGGHFPGSAVARWADGAAGRGVLLTGDTVAPNADRATVTFLRSFPNRIPLSAAVVERIGATLGALEFDRIIDAFGARIEQDARAAVEASVRRYAAWVRGEYDHLT